MILGVGLMVAMELSPMCLAGAHPPASLAGRCRKRGFDPRLLSWTLASEVQPRESPHVPSSAQCRECR